MKHFEYTGETKEAYGVTLRRIRYTKFLPQHDIKVGDVGGWIEKDANLSGSACVLGNASVSGNARVSGDAHVSDYARVFCNARVSGNARVLGNASVSDDASVCGEAILSDNAVVCGDAHVSGDAIVSGDAFVCGDARISGDARVYDKACVYGGDWYKSPLYIQGTRWAVVMCTDKLLKIGCEEHTLEDWRQNYLEIARANHAEDIAAEYKLYIDLCCARYMQEDKNETDSI